MSFDGDLYPSAGASVVMTTKGDVVRFDSERERYGIGSSGQVLAVQSNLPTWIDADSITHNVAVQFACGDETTAIGATGQVLSFRMPFAMTLNAGILGVKGSLVTAGTGECSDKKPCCNAWDILCEMGGECSKPPKPNECGCLPFDIGCEIGCWWEKNKNYVYLIGGLIGLGVLLWLLRPLFGIAKNITET